MPSSEQIPFTPRMAKSPLRTAMEARDLPAISNAFAPDAVFHSPLTERLNFNGREQIGALLRVILDAFEGFRYTDELHDERGGFLVARARIGGQDIEIVDHMQFGPDGRIRDFTVFFRPLPATAVALRVIGVGLGRQKSPARAMIISALAHPLEIMTRIGDAIGIRLLRPVL